MWRCAPSFVAGVELANGYEELTEWAETQRRIHGWNATRRAAGLSLHPPDPGFLAAVRAGLPPCAGMALGVDRLLMLLAGAGTVAAVRLGATAGVVRKAPLIRKVIRNPRSRSGV